MFIIFDCVAILLSTSSEMRIVELLCASVSVSGPQKFGRGNVSARTLHVFSITTSGEPEQQPLHVLTERRPFH